MQRKRVAHHKKTDFAGKIVLALIWIGSILMFPMNSFLHSATQIQDINAHLPAKYALMLIVISVVLTTLGGIIPAHNASKSDPVEALRAE